MAAAAHKAGTWLFEDVLAAFGGRAAILDASLQPGETTVSALERLAEAAVNHARHGARLLALDDGAAFLDGHGWLDHHLALAVVDRALRLETDRTATTCGAGAA